ncbi:MAG: hypothetical protein CR986_03040 [Ignavibacteriae bacterium]|nr:MAG: hypothetical protein CR986_03040 [Ignavibacteriota bacterium]
MKILFQKFYLLFFLIVLLALKVKAQENFIEVYLEGTKITDIKSDGTDLWVATEGDGIFKYSKVKDKWQNFSSKNKKIKQDFFYCIETGKRYIWAGSPDGLYTYDKKRRRWRKKKFSLGGQFGNWIRNLKFDRRNNILWIGRFKYLSQFNLLTKKYSDFDLTINKNDKTNTINTIALDKNNVVWVGTEAGVHKLKFKRNFKKAFSSEFYNTHNHFFMEEGEEVSVTNILFEQNNIWFGTEEFITYERPDFNIGGLFRFDREINWLRFGENNDKLKGNGIYSIEKIGNYILASVYKFNPTRKKRQGKGINILNRKTLKIKNVKNDLIPEDIFKIYFDKENIWLGTKNGLRKIKLKSKFIPNFN